MIKKKGRGKDFLLTEVFLLSQSLALVNALIISYDFCPISKSLFSTKSAFFIVVLQTRFPLPKLRQMKSRKFKLLYGHPVYFSRLHWICIIFIFK